jgi:hypothetical protein
MTALGGMRGFNDAHTDFAGGHGQLLLFLGCHSFLLKKYIVRQFIVCDFITQYTA